MTTTTNILPILRYALLFENADDSVLRDVAAQCLTLNLEAGEILFEQDASPDALYILTDGQVHIVRTYPNGHEVILATEGPFYIIGELSLLANQPRTGSVVAVSDCEIIRLSRDSILDICQRVPDIPFLALTRLGERLYRMNLLVRESAIGNVNARVASVLLLLAHSEPGPIAGSIPVTRLARATALDADIVEHLIKQWAAKGIISYEHQTLTIHDLDAIHDLAG
jgi:CRP-like cAMP-binding protein